MNYDADVIMKNISDAGPCGCSFNPTSSSDYCEQHRPIDLNDCQEKVRGITYNNLFGVHQGDLAVFVTGGGAACRIPHGTSIKDTVRELRLLADRLERSVSERMYLARIP